MAEISCDVIINKSLDCKIEKAKTVVDSNYELLENKPSINGNELIGNKSFEDLGLIFDNETIVKENGMLTVADNSHNHTIENVSGLGAALENAEAHAANKNNPHNVTKEQISLGNVENKSSEAIRSEITSDNIVDALGFMPLSSDGAAESVSNTVRRQMRPSDLFRIY